jgi:hypothetical protein
MSSSHVSNDITTEASVAAAVPMRRDADVAAGRHMAEIRHVVVPSAT